jgi:hypothetical protein
LLTLLLMRCSLCLLLQGLAAGLMLSISVMDLLPEAAEEIGFVAANACFYAGVLFFAAIVALIPEPDAQFFAGYLSTSSKKAAVDSSSKPAPAAHDDEAREQLLVEAAAANSALAGTAAGSTAADGKVVLLRASSSR